MLKTQELQSFLGFGNGQQPGEHFYSQNFRTSRFGLIPGWKMSVASTNALLTNLGKVNWFAEVGAYVYSVDDNGYIHRTDVGTSSNWTQIHQISVATSHGNGLLSDQKGRLLYMNDKFLGKFESAVWTDNWKDLGSIITDFRPVEAYEDLVIIGNGNTLAVLDSTDTLNTAGFTLPTGFTVRAVKATSKGIGILANFGALSVFLIWDGSSDRSTAPWLWFNAPGQALAQNGDDWVVVTAREIVQTNGYSKRKLPNLPDAKLDENSFTVIPQGCVVLDNLLFLNNSYVASTYNRRKNGLWVLDLTAGLWNFIPVGNECVNGVTALAILQDSQAKIHTSYSTTTPASKAIGNLQLTLPNRATLILERLGATPSKKVAKSLQLLAQVDPQAENNYPLTFDVSLKIATERRQLWNYAVENGVAPATNKLVVDGTAGGRNNAQAGDEVTILQGANAGQVRHILSIANQGSVSETWTLDSALPTLAENGVIIQVQPFQLVKKWSASNLTELSDIFFDIQNSPKGRSFYAKLLFENFALPVAIELTGGEFIYDDLGVL